MALLVLANPLQSFLLMNKYTDIYLHEILTGGNLFSDVVSACFWTLIFGSTFSLFGLCTLY